MSVAGPAELPVTSSPQTYTPERLVEKILTSRAALEGERKQISVLFADLKGSMELLADRDPEEARKLLDPVLERMMEAVHHYEGTVNQVLGDGIMALFGAPVAHEDHAIRACYAALRMLRRVTLYADELQRGGGTPVHIRVGVNSGEVVVGAVGGDYTAIGQTTHLAARMEQMARPGSALITGDTLKLAEGYVHVRPLGAVPVKGLATAQSVYELTGVVPARSRVQASAARGLTRFVGRDSELRQLAQALEHAGAGRGQVVAAVGEAGVGKSRLFWEFARSHHLHDWLVLDSGAVSFGKATPYLPLIELLKAYCGIQERDDPRVIRERVAGKLLMLDRALEPLLAPLLALLDVPGQDAAWDALDPPQRRQRTLEAVKRLLLRESQVQPLLVILEDLHWIDSETQALLDGLVESLPTARVLLLVNYRPEYQHGWSAKTYYLQLRVDPLLPASAEELLTAVLGHDRTLEPLKRALIERTESNPFFLEESIQTLVETQVLVGERGAYRLGRAPETWQIPATAQAVLAARIDRLPLPDKRILQAAAVVGKAVPFALLRAIADVPEDNVQQGLVHLQAAEFLYETSLFPDREYRFKHALTHEVTYESVLHDRRRALHRQVLQAIEGLYPERRAEHVERLAHHAFQAEEWSTAVTYLRQAGAKAFARSAHREAVDYFEQALAALQHLPETPDGLAQAIDLRFDLRPSLFALNELPKVIAHIHEADRLAQNLGDQRRLGWVSVYKSHYLWSTGRAAEARTFAERARTLAEALDDLPLRVGANHYLGSVCLTSGAYRQAESFLRTVVELLAGERQRDRCGLTAYPATMAHGYLAWILAERGAFNEGVIHGQEGLRLAETLGHPYSVINASWGPAHLYRLRGDLPHALRLLEHARALCREWEIRRLSGTTAGFLGFVYVLSGRVAEGLALLSEAQDSDEQWQTLIVAHMAEACLLADRLEDAIAFAGRALMLARERGQRGYEAHILRLHGEMAAHGDSWDVAGAENHYRQAMVLAEELGMRPLLVHCHLGLGRLARRTGQRDRAQEHLSTAGTMLGDMGMSFWLEQAERELRMVR